jgi:integrase
MLTNKKPPAATGKGRGKHREKRIKILDLKPHWLANDGVRWEEIDFENAWKVPAQRMKAGRQYLVPLSARAIEILRAQPTGEQPFPLSSMALLMLLRRMGRSDVTGYGFRSSFRDWAAERTNFPNEVVEMALAHNVADAVEAAYRRGDLFDRLALS